MYASVRFFAILVFAAAYTVIPSLSTPLVESSLAVRDPGPSGGDPLNSPQSQGPRAALLHRQTGCKGQCLASPQDCAGSQCQGCISILKYTGSTAGWSLARALLKKRNDMGAMLANDGWGKRSGDTVGNVVRGWDEFEETGYLATIWIIGTLSKCTNITPALADSPEHWNCVSASLWLLLHNLCHVVMTSHHRLVIVIISDLQSMSLLTLSHTSLQIAMVIFTARKLCPPVIYMGQQLGVVPTTLTWWGQGALYTQAGCRWYSVLAGLAWYYGRGKQKKKSHFFGSGTRSATYINVQKIKNIGNQSNVATSNLPFLPDPPDLGTST
ncbi:hypothetical protein V8E53_013424 [Lactarius tabidus]